MPDQALNFDSKDEKSKQADLNVPLNGTLGVGGLTTTPGSTGAAHAKGNDIEIDLKLKAPGGIGAPETETTTSAEQSETPTAEATPETTETEDEAKPAGAAEEVGQKSKSADEDKKEKPPTEGEKPEAKKERPPKGAEKNAPAEPESETGTKPEGEPETAPDAGAVGPTPEENPTEPQSAGQRLKNLEDENKKNPPKSDDEKMARKKELNDATKDALAEKQAPKKTPKQAGSQSEQAPGTTPPAAPTEPPKKVAPEPPPTAPARNASRSDAGGPPPQTGPAGGAPPPASPTAAGDLGRDKAQDRRAEQTAGHGGAPGAGGAGPQAGGPKKSIGNRVKDNLGDRWQNSKNQLNPAEQARQAGDRAKEGLNAATAPAMTILNSRKIFRLDKQIKETDKKIKGLSRALAPLQKEMAKKIKEAKKYKRRVRYLKIVAWSLGITIIGAPADTALVAYIVELKEKMKAAGKAAADLKQQIKDQQKNLGLYNQRRKELFTARANLQRVFKTQPAPAEPAS